MSESRAERAKRSETGLYFSERKLWDECPQAHRVLERLARERKLRRYLEDRLARTSPPV